jgi:radical SAM protein with 4Fe4S-binding SPASM domain
MGNITKDDLQEIWINHPILKKIRERRAISLDEIETCADCKYKGYCTGGCPGGALFFYHDVNARNPMDCYRILMGEEVFNPGTSVTDGENKHA